MKKYFYCLMWSMVLSTACFCQESFSLKTNEKYTFILANGTSYTGKLSEIDREYYLVEIEEEEMNDTIRIIKKELRSIKPITPITTKKRDLTAVSHQEPPRVYAGLGLGITYIIPRPEFRLNIGASISGSHICEGTFFTIPGVLSNRTGVGINYSSTTENKAWTVGVGYVHYKYSLPTLQVVNFVIFKYPTITYKDYSVNSAYANFGFHFTNKERTWLVGMNLMNYGISKDERANLLSLNVLRRSFL